MTNDPKALTDVELETVTGATDLSIAPLDETAISHKGGAGKVKYDKLTIKKK